MKEDKCKNQELQYQLETKESDEIRVQELLSVLTAMRDDWHEQILKLKKNEKERQKEHQKLIDELNNKKVEYEILISQLRILCGKSK